MDEIRLDGRLWRTANDFYTAYLSAVGAPDWHGRNLDAVWDSLTGGDLNRRNPPLRVRITGLADMGGDARQVVERFLAISRGASAEGHIVEVELEN